ncbi:MAG: adenosylcobinamide-GDP ribazoletransferase [Spirochaetes bacterium]|nr:MAG: adenosylcobinamide-GDP ribazoletransferase [Spirochaetota bacterium]
MKKLIKQIIFAVTFLTIIPGPKKLNITSEDTGRSMAFYPVVGVIIGIFLFLISRYGYISAFTTSIFITVFLLLITRGLHADGLIDSFDGFLSGTKDTDKILEIMKDSNIGALGFIAAFSVYLIKIALIYELLTRKGINYPYYLMILPALSRSGVPFAVYLFKYPRKKGGLGRDFFSSIGITQVLISFFITVIFTLEKGTYKNLLLAPAVFIFWLIWGLICKKKIGGMTGDTIGAGIELSEVFSIALILSISGLKF